MRLIFQNSPIFEGHYACLARRRPLKDAWKSFVPPYFLKSGTSRVKDTLEVGYSSQLQWQLK